MLAHGYFGAAKPRCCGYTTQRFRWPKRASMAEAGITCDYPFIKMGCHQRAICTLTLLAEQFRTQAAYFGVVLMEKRALRLLWPQRTAVRAVVWAIALFDTWSHQEHSANQASRRHADLQQACQYFLQQHRQAFTTCCPTCSVIEASCFVLVCQGYIAKAKLRNRLCT